MTKNEAYELVRFLTEAYANDWTPERVEVWANLLVDLDYERAHSAILYWATSEKWAPSIAEIRQLALVGEQKFAADGWGAVLKEIARVGAWGEPEFDDPAVARAVDSLGWQNLCHSENPVADRARFMEFYGQFSVKGVREKVVPDNVRQLITQGPQIKQVEALPGPAKELKE